MTQPARINSVTSLIEAGLDGLLVDVECHITNGLPSIIIVGFANRSIDEAKERLRGAFSSSGLVLPRKRITLNLAPGDIPKDGASFDLALAAAIILADQPFQQPLAKDEIIIGELGLDGRVRAGRGIIGKLIAGRKRGVKRCFIPAANLPQANLVPGLELVAITNLKMLYDHLTGRQPARSQPSGQGLANLAAQPAPLIDLQMISGQSRGKRALEVAAAGQHNLLLSGPPGVGKSMLAKALPGLLPALLPDEILEVTHLNSLSSPQFEHIIKFRPFRSPHHSTSLKALIGGGNPPTPGEISLSHHGVLFLDELPEFSRGTIEALRQPMEDGQISIARGRQSITYPARFLLVATANPCPCGYYNTTKTCRCQAHQIAHYQRKLSGPILDRIDLSVEVNQTDHQKLLVKFPNCESTASVAQRITAAQQIQLKRQGCLNGQLDNVGIKKQAKLSPDAKIFVDRAGKKLGISARSYLKTVKVARTIADLAEKQQIETMHVIEAMQFRHQVASPL